MEPGVVRLEAGTVVQVASYVQAKKWGAEKRDLMCFRPKTRCNYLTDRNGRAGKRLPASCLDCVHSLRDAEGREVTGERRRGSFLADMLRMRKLGTEQVGPPDRTTSMCRCQKSRLEAQTWDQSCYGC